MTTKQLVKTLSQRTGVNQRRVEELLYELANVVGENMTKGEKTSLMNFGTFRLGKRAARHGVDPRHGNDIQIPEMPMPALRFSEVFKRQFRK